MGGRRLCCRVQEDRYRSNLGVHAVDMQSRPEEHRRDAGFGPRSDAMANTSSHRPGSRGPRPPGELELAAVDVWKSFGAHPVLRGISLDVTRGQMVAIVGGSGCGKSVLLRHFLGHFRPDAGRVWAADHESPGGPLVDLSTLDGTAIDRLRRHWGVVFQGNALFAGTVYDNIALALREVKGWPEEAIRTRAEQVVGAVGLKVAEVLRLDRGELSGGMARGSRPRAPSGRRCWSRTTGTCCTACGRG